MIKFYEILESGKRLFIKSFNKWEDAEDAEEALDVWKVHNPKKEAFIGLALSDYLLSIDKPLK